jgi:hypothetical protein
MPDKIFQKFDLDLESLAKLLEIESIHHLDKLTDIGMQKIKSLNFPKATETLRKEMSAKDYEILESSDMYCGLHESIIIGGILGKMDIKGDFYSLTEKLKMPYKSGICYFPRTSNEKQ